ncbi:hypothetical protein BC940DRAFT_67995 [Gongronella butleri]|nr:hypothetical protein BC940DRAFT_67995 [Gongronella butleri]
MKIKWEFQTLHHFCATTLFHVSYSARRYRPADTNTKMKKKIQNKHVCHKSKKELGQTRRLTDAHDAQTHSGRQLARFFVHHPRLAQGVAAQAAKRGCTRQFARQAVFVRRTTRDGVFHHLISVRCHEGTRKKKKKKRRQTRKKKSLSPQGSPAIPRHQKLSTTFSQE